MVARQGRFRITPLGPCGSNGRVVEILSVGNVCLGVDHMARPAERLGFNLRAVSEHDKVAIDITAAMVHHHGCERGGDRVGPARFKPDMGVQAPT